MAEALDAKQRAFRQLAADTGVDLSEDDELDAQNARARAAAAAAAAAADPRKRFAFDDDEDEDYDAADRGSSAAARAAAQQQQLQLQQQAEQHDDEYDREHAIAASFMSVPARPSPVVDPVIEPAPIAVASVPEVTPITVHVPEPAPTPATNPFASAAPKQANPPTATNPFHGTQAPPTTSQASTNPFASNVATTASTSSVAAAAAAAAAVPASSSSASLRTLHSMQYTAGAAGSSAPQPGVAATAAANKRGDAVEIFQVAKQHGFVLTAVEMPGLPWLVRIGEPEVRNPLNPATKFVVYPVMTKVFGWKVERRFSDFIWLREHLLRVFPGVLVPPLPDKKFFGRFGDSFVEKRREALERFLNKCTMHRQLRSSDALRFFLEKRDNKLFEQEKADYASTLPRMDPAVFDRGRAIDQNVMAMLAPIINYLNVMQEYLLGLAQLTSSLERRRHEEAEELRRMGATFGALFACAESGGYCWKEKCDECELVGAQMQSLGLRSARVSQVVDDCGANIYNAVWRSVRDECDVVASLREQVHQRVMVEAEYKMSVENLKETRAQRANVLARGAPKGKDSPAAKLAQQVLQEEALAAALKFKLDYCTMVLLDELDGFHQRKAATFGVLLNHYATQSAFAAEQLHQAWADVLRAAQTIAQK